MPNMPTLETPNLMAGYGQLAQNVQGGFSHLAEGIKQYGVFKNEQEVKAAIAGKLDQEFGTGTADLLKDKLAKSSLKEAAQAYQNLRQYKDSMMQAKEVDPEFTFLGVKSPLAPILWDATPEQVVSVVDKMQGRMSERKTEIKTAAQEKTLGELSTGLNAGGFDTMPQPLSIKTSVGTGEIPIADGMAVSGAPGETRPGVSEIPKAEFIGRGTAQREGGLVTQETAMKGLSEVAEPTGIDKQNLETFRQQYQPQSALDKAAYNAKKLENDLARIRQYAAKVANDKSYQELNAAILATSKATEATNRKQGLFAAAEKARATASEKSNTRGEEGAALYYENMANYLENNADYLTENIDAIQRIASRAVQKTEEKHGVTPAQKPIPLVSGDAGSAKAYKAAKPGTWFVDTATGKEFQKKKGK